MSSNVAASLPWLVRGREIDAGARPLIMGVVNVTPDSFSDGGWYAQPEQAVAHALDLIQQGADILDIGGESTRPGALPVAAGEQLARVLPVVEALRASGRAGDVLLSIDTSSAEVAARCLEAGAHVINDVTALRGDAAMPEVARQFGAGVILMHMQGTPATMQQAPEYQEVVGDVYTFLEERLQACVNLGIARASLVVDPGVGFGKRDDHNWELLAQLGELRALARPVCLGVSRKGFLGRLLGRDLAGRAAGSLAVALDAVMHRTAQLLRVHDVAATWDALRVLATLAGQREKRI
jgi:dihydropteroate synthase